MNYKQLMLFSALILSITTPLWGQGLIVPKDQRTRFKFAQTYMGGSIQYLPGATLDMSDGSSHEFSSLLHPRFIIGGTHFWGFLDFYISMPLSSTLNISEHPEGANIDFNTGVMTGMKVYPFAMHNSRISPFVGASWSFYNIRAQFGEQEAPRLTNHRIALEAGISYTTRDWSIFEMFGTYTPNTSVNYYTSRTEVGRFNWPGWSLGISYKKMFDSTEGSELIENLDDKEHLNTWHFGIGPSTTQALQSSEFMTAETPWMNNPGGWSIFPEMSLGYYWHKPDLDVRLTFRPMRSVQRGYGIKQEVDRQSLAAEAFINLFDYHGFVPFIGGSLAVEWHRFRQTGDHISQFDEKSRGVFPGVVFGWDIRPNRYKSWLLRTNLRFYPTAEMAINDKAFSMNQLEFNFIQVVIFPDRLFE